MKKTYLLLSLMSLGSLSFAQFNAKLTPTDNKALQASVINFDANQSTQGTYIDSLLNYKTENTLDWKGLGSQTADSLEIYSFFSKAKLANHNTAGDVITSVRVALVVGQIKTTTLMIRSGQTGPVIYKQTFYPIQTGWNEVVLTTPLTIPATDLYIGFRIVTNPAPQGWLVVDSGPVNADGNWVNDDGTWGHLDVLSQNTVPYNWIIKAMVEKGNGVEELSTTKLSIFPNPVTNNLTINNAKIGSTLEIVNTLGVIVHSEKVNNSNTTINVASFDNGVYFVRTTNGKEVGTKTFVKL